VSYYMFTSWLSEWTYIDCVHDLALLVCQREWIDREAHRSTSGTVGVLFETRSQTNS